MKYIILLVSIFLLPSLSVEKAPVHKTRVAVIDTGLDINDPRFSEYVCPGESRDFTGTGLVDTNGHGTHVASLIISRAQNKDFCLIILKYYVENYSDSQNSKSYEQSLGYVYQINPDIVNYSGSGDSYSDVEEAVIRALPETKFFVSAGNQGESFLDSKFYPASLTIRYNNVIVIGNGIDENHMWDSSNYNYPNMKWVNGHHISGYAPGHGFQLMSGSSQSTAIYTGLYLKEQNGKTKNN